MQTQLSDMSKSFHGMKLHIDGLAEKVNSIERKQLELNCDVNGIVDRLESLETDSIK